MRRKDCDIRVGTSGWYYDHWRGRFYPEELPKSRWFEFYAQQFDTVELNNTFYHLPREQTVTAWHDKAPAGFLFAVKASRYITHVKKLNDPDESLARFFSSATLLKRRLGPILYQLPPSLHKDLDRLDAFITALPRPDSAVFEFRHASWYDQDTFDLLGAHDIGICVHDMPGNESPRITTGRMVYVRFHGATGRYAGNYSDTMLDEWAHWFKDQASKVRAIYVFFNNDAEGHAVDNAQTLKKLLTI